MAKPVQSSVVWRYGVRIVIVLVVAALIRAILRGIALGHAARQY
ncbi:MAG: hypothetical protein ACRBBV_13655 [Paracoccaceae bacterium]